MFGEKGNIRKMANLSRAFFGEGNIDDVKAEVRGGIAQRIKVIAAGTPQFGFLAGIDRLHPRDARALSAGAHFNKNQDFPVAANQVNLIVMEAPIAGNDPIPQFVTTKAGGECFPVPAFFRTGRFRAEGSRFRHKQTAYFLDQLQRKCLRRRTCR